MSILVVRLTKPDETIYLESSPEGFQRLYLHQWKGFGLAQGEPTLYLQMEHQDFDQVWGNVGNRVPLLFTASKTNPGGTFLPLGGRIKWSDCRRLRFTITNFDWTPAVFSELVLVIKGEPPHPRQMEISNLDLFIRQG